MSLTTDTFDGKSDEMAGNGHDSSGNAGDAAGSTTGGTGNKVTSIEAGRKATSAGGQPVRPEQEQEPRGQELQGAEAQQGAPEPPATIRAFDQYGREVMVPRAEWATNVLPNMVKEAWDQPDQLYAVIVNSLNDGFMTEMAEAAQHLYETDTVPARGTCMWGIVLMQTGRLSEAEQVLSGFEENHAPDGAVLVNLAKAYAARGDVQLAEDTLWRSLELDPNIENSLGWYTAIQAERAGEGGEEAGRASLERVAAMPGSWRAQLWLARAELTRGNVGKAREYYSHALGRAPRPVPADLLMQMSGDLGGGGHLNELLEFTAPFFVPEMHGLPVGNNLIKAYVDLGNLGAADAIKNTLYGFGRPDWKDALAFWDADIARRRVGAVNATANAAQPTEGAQQQQIQIGMLRVDGPIWLPPGSPARGIFGQKAQGGPSVTFLGGSAEAPQQPTQAELQISDALGRMTRALPLFLAEQTEMRTAAQGRALIPWAVGQGPGGASGFVVSGTRWPDETAVQMVGDPANQSDYVVTVHVDAEVEPWTADLAFVRTSDGARIGELSAEFMPGEPEAGLPGLADEVVELLSAFGEQASPAVYQVPEDGLFGTYLVRLEQLLAVRCSGMDGVPAQFLNGEREILSGDLDLCLNEPQSTVARLLLVETLGAMSRTRPQVAEEFRERFQRLVAELPLPAVDAAFSQA